MDNWMVAIICIIAVGVLIIVTMETIYFTRMIFCYFMARFIKKRVHILEKCTLSGICTTRDVDMILTHMNNARYLREVDMGRIDFYIRSRLWEVVKSQNGQILLGTAFVRFRKYVGLFQRFKLTTKIVYWNEDSIFIEHKFVGRDGFVHCTLLCQQRLVNCSGEIVMDILLKKGSSILPKPDMPMEIMSMGTFLCVVIFIIFILHCFFEVHYFLRMTLCVILARFTKKKAHILDQTSFGGICLSNDIDTLITHMNNSRYLRELDFARVDFYERTGLYKTVRNLKGGIVQGAATIRYRRFIKPFSVFDITTKIIYWDPQSIYMESRFVGKDGFIHAIAICKQRLIDCSADDVMDLLLKETPTVESSTEKLENGDLVRLKPEMPLEVQKWNECNEISSANLRRI
ncbi:CLUMA_CG004462, isoform A [Clunio marinus]|uniref:Protein THEM6 n=1 Tax=Clunio marinus TaxID=568069 RepID=A0A1J1HT82_9DIPT|nr:CLUMA_CG004462, isoform A [Clunio marinus]